MTGFILLCIVMALFILIQQGKGDMGLGSLSGGQALFGGSGGQEFFERATWVMCALFIIGSLCLTILKTRASQTSRITNHITQTARAASRKPELPRTPPGSTKNNS